MTAQPSSSASGHVTDFDFVLVPYWISPGKKLRPVFADNSPLCPDGYFKMKATQKPASWDLLRLWRNPPFDTVFAHCELAECWIQDQIYPPDTPPQPVPPSPRNCKFLMAEKPLSLHEPLCKNPKKGGRHGCSEVIVVMAAADRFILPPVMTGTSRLI